MEVTYNNVILQNGWTQQTDIIYFFQKIKIPGLVMSVKKTKLHRIEILHMTIILGLSC